MDQIDLNKQLGNHLNQDIINASNYLPRLDVLPLAIKTMLTKRVTPVVVVIIIRILFRIRFFPAGPGSGSVNLDHAFAVGHGVAVARLAPVESRVHRVESLKDDSEVNRIRLFPRLSLTLRKK